MAAVAQCSGTIQVKRVRAVRGSLLYFSCDGRGLHSEQTAAFCSWRDLYTYGSCWRKTRGEEKAPKRCGRQCTSVADRLVSAARIRSVETATQSAELEMQRLQHNMVGASMFPCLSVVLTIRRLCRQPKGQQARWLVLGTDWNSELCVCGFCGCS